MAALLGATGGGYSSSAVARGDAGTGAQKFDFGGINTGGSGVPSWAWIGIGVGVLLIVALVLRR